jgi:serine/threonine-protein kinase
VPILEYGEISGKPFVAMPFYPGGDAESRRKAGTLPPRYRIFEAIAQAANALDAARSYGVVHHDIKSSNMFFDAADNMYVGDFDTADIRKDDDNLSRCPGWVTPAYSSPEKLEFASESFKGDIFSLGVTAYELLCDRQPFSSKGAIYSLLDERRERKFPTPGEIHPEMEGEVSDLIMSMMEYDPSMRPEYQEIAVVFKMLAED